MKKERSEKGLGPGFKRTPQRVAIFDYLEGNTTHPSAEDIYRAVSKKHHSMSFATVYNTMNSLTAVGAIRELTIDPERRRYDPDTSAHNHLICIVCRKVQDAPGEIRVDLPKGTAADFAVIGNHIEFYGYCAGCKRKKK